MRFYPRRTPRKKADILIEKIASGKCDDLAVNELKVAVEEVTEPEEIQRISWAILDIAINSANNNAAAYAIKSIMIFLPMSKEIEDALERRLLALLEDKSALSNKVLLAAISEYLNVKTSENLDIARPFIPTLLGFLDEHYGNIAVNAYTILMDCATDRPEYFDPYSSNLVRQLGSINNTTRIQTSRLISVLGKLNPDYTGEAERILSHLSTFYPDADVKSAASEAYQSLNFNQVSTEDPVEDAHVKEEPKSGSMAEIIRRKVADSEKPWPQKAANDSKLFSLASNIAWKTDSRNQGGSTAAGGKKNRGQQPERQENDKEVMDMIIDDFSEIAASIHNDKSDSENSAGREPSVERVPASEKTEHLKPQQPELIKARSPEPGSFGKAEPPKPQQPDFIKIRQTEPIPSDMLGTIKPSQPEKNQTYYDPEVEHLEEVLTPEELELKDMVNRVKTDFSISAESLLDSIGMGHLHSDSSDRKETKPENTVVKQTSPPQEPVKITPVPQEKPKIELKEESKSLPVPENQPAKTVESVPVKVDESTPAKVDEKVPVKAAEPVVPPEKKAPVIPKAPVMPAGVRLPSMKFTTLDNAKKTAHSIVSIKPHIKPLNRTPRDVSKLTQPKPQQATEQQPADNKPANDIKVETPAPVKDPAAAVKEQICPTCGAKIAEDLQYCVKCGFDVASQKYRCGKCGQINAQESNTCVRCGTKLLKPVIKSE